MDACILHFFWSPYYLLVFLFLFIPGEGRGKKRLASLAATSGCFFLLPFSFGLLGLSCLVYLEYPIS